MQDVGVSIVKGGMHRVSRALADELKAHGGEIRTGAGVSRIEVAKGRVSGVTLESGETIGCDGVLASNVDPGHLVLDLLGEPQAGETVTGKKRRYEWGQSFFASISRSIAQSLTGRAAAPIKPVMSISAAIRSTIWRTPSRKPGPDYCRTGP